MHWSSLLLPKATNPTTENPAVMHPHWNVCHAFNLDRRYSPPFQVAVPRSTPQPCQMCPPYTCISTAWKPPRFAICQTDGWETLLHSWSVTCPWLLGKGDFNSIDCQLYHQHLLGSTFPLLTGNSTSINQVTPISYYLGIFHIKVFRISVLLSNILDTAWFIHWSVKFPTSMYILNQVVSKIRRQWFKVKSNRKRKNSVFSVKGTFHEEFKF